MSTFCVVLMTVSIEECTHCIPVAELFLFRCQCYLILIFPKLGVIQYIQCCCIYLVRFICPTDNIALTGPDVLISAADINSIHLLPSSQSPKHDREISLSKLNFAKIDFFG